jgi:hypothetical protein
MLRKKLRNPSEIATPRQVGARNDSEVEKGLAMTREVTVPVKNTGKAGYNR